MIPIACKFSSFSLYMFVYFFENIIISFISLILRIATALKERMAGTPQGLTFGAPISQHASYSAMFCPLHSNISKEQHEKHLCNPSSHYGN